MSTQDPVFFVLLIGGIAVIIGLALLANIASGVNKNKD